MGDATRALYDDALEDQEPDIEASGAPERRRYGPRPLVLGDPLYGEVRVAAWAAALLDTEPFRRLAGVSLSDVPGELLFGHAFPSRLDHACGVYHLVRRARPRDRTLQAAALAHDLGHGPFSHLTEGLMGEWLGLDHEERSAHLLDDVRAGLTTPGRRLVEWLDWDEVAALILGRTDDGRGQLLNGLVDFDNADNVARFLLCSGLGRPSYDPLALGSALRVSDAPLAGGGHVYLARQGEYDALGWRADRGRVYDYLHERHRNLAAHAMLRKAIDLAATAHALPRDFLDATDARALAVLRATQAAGVAALAGAVTDDRLYVGAWQGILPDAARDLRRAIAERPRRLALEARLASEAGLNAHEVIVEALVSSAERELPPLAPDGRPSAAVAFEPPVEAPCVVHVFAAPSARPDYRRRLAGAAGRALVAMGASPRR